MKKIGIIGGGFTGTMTVVQLIAQSTQPVDIILINKTDTLNVGIAYNPYSAQHLLNVRAGEMSAYPDQPNHFLDWVMKRKEFQQQDATQVANSFLPRKLYGDYLRRIWSESLAMAEAKNISVTQIDGYVSDLRPGEKTVALVLKNGEAVEVDYCIVATGNHPPRHPQITDPVFYKSRLYYQDPWKLDAVSNTSSHLPVLIIGNGLTMADTVIGLREQGFAGEIVTISPNGFNMLPHAEPGHHHAGISDAAMRQLNLADWIQLVNHHKRAAEIAGTSGQFIIDTIRPFVQSIWRSFTEWDRHIFMSRIRHVWNMVRHRLPGSIHDELQEQRDQQKLCAIAGQLVSITEFNGSARVSYLDKSSDTLQEIDVSRVINCTGPETDISRLENSFLKNCLDNGWLTQDPLKLGIRTDVDTYRVLRSDHQPHPNLFTIGVNLKGELWESTAVGELRKQAEQLATYLVSLLQFPVLQHEA